MSNPNNQKPDRNDYKYDIRFDKLPEPSRLPYPGKRPSRLVLFLLMGVPGLGHMYMGLIRRGLFFFSALPLLIYFTVSAARVFPFLTVFTGFSIAALYAVSFFESLAIRRDIVEGKEVMDTIPNVRALAKNKLLMAIIIIIVAISVLHTILSAIPHVVLVIAAVAAIAHFIGRRQGGKIDNDGNQ